MSDRELLELAAKAAGIKVDRVLLRSDGSVDQFNVRSPDGTVGGWNPLASWGTGDALSLAVKLRIDLDFDEMNPFVEAYRKEPDGASFCADEALTGDPDAATCRAIVRAAAEIGRQA